MYSKKLLMALLVLIVLTGVSIGIARRSSEQHDSRQGLVSSAMLQSLPKKAASGIDTSHLAAGLLPPTNTWFSGIALQQKPRAVFPTPLSFWPKDSSFEIGLPTPKTTEKTIFGGHVASLAAEIQGASNYRVVRYDELSVDVEYAAGDKKLGVATITSGSPYVFFRASGETTVVVRGEGAIATDENGARFTSSKNTSVILGFDGAALAQQANGIAARLSEGAYMTFYMLPNGHTDMLKAMAGNRVVGTAVTYEKSGGTYKTNIQLKTANGKATALGLLPHQEINLPLAPLTYQTIYGQLRVTEGNEITFSNEAIGIIGQLDLTGISAEEKRLLSTTLRRDINATKFEADDTYSAGKALYRAAQLLELAKQLGETQVAASMQRKLTAELGVWVSGGTGRSKKYFYYDTDAKGIVGETAAFGSEAFNDHHFHYGYFIYAASVLAKYDTDFLTQHKDMVNLLVADIANYNEGEQLPLRRSFDPYFGHSWASGSAPFDDGNNQESVSEAINAWVGVGLWAQQIQDTDLQKQSEWMLSNETAAANAYWLGFDQGTPPYSAGYAKSIVSLNWGGKRDYATFFSDKPNAMLGILLIPMNPTMAHQLTAAVRIERNIQEAVPDGSYAMQFGDYLLMYKSLQHPGGLLEKAKKLPEEVIDSANSRSYLYAWLMAQDSAR